MDADVKNVLFDIHERASIKRTSMVAAREKASEPKPTTVRAEPTTVTEESSERGPFDTFLSKKHIDNSQCLRFEGNEVYSNKTSNLWQGINSKENLIF